jgi:hypothetical protein
MVLATLSLALRASAIVDALRIVVNRICAATAGHLVLGY